METKPLGRTGIQIPEVGYGTWKYKGDPRTIQRALELGASLIDTAEVYGTERFVGEAIRGNRDAYFIATKVSPSHFRFDDVLAAADRSLKTLGIDTIDLYQLHWPNPKVPLEETLGAMDKLVSAGKVRHIGVSNFSVDLLREAEACLGEGRIVENQIKYSLLDHGDADEVVSYCRDRGMTVMAYSSLEQGAFDERIRQRPELVTTVDDIAREWGKTRAQVLLNWAIGEPNVVTIPMTNRAERVDENCAASGWYLTAEQRDCLAQAAGGW